MRRVFLVTLLSFVSLSIYAVETPKIDERIKDQRGQINEKEKAALDKQQGKIQTAKEKAKSDGAVTKKEKAKIKKMQDRANERIYKAKHDRS